MTSFTIEDNDLDQIKDQVVVITGMPPDSRYIIRSHLSGASSGIGLATLRRIVKHGGKVYAGDLNPLPSPEADTVPFSRVDVTDWKQQLEL